MFIILKNKPYAYDKTKGLIYGVNISGLSYSVDRSMSAKAPKDIGCFYTIDEIRQRFNIVVNVTKNMRTGVTTKTSSGTITSSVKEMVAPATAPTKNAEEK